MTTISELIDDLVRQEVELWFEGDKLHYRTPKGALKEDTRAILIENKATVVDILKRRASIVQSTFPLSYGQRALWFIHQAAPEGAAYNVAFTARICSELDITAFEKAVQALVDRHACLRTTYVFNNGQPIQQVHGYMEARITVREARGVDDAQLRNMVTTAHKQPFDLEKGPLFRVDIFRCDEKNYVLLISLHHIACDGWSVMILLEELCALYAANKRKTAVKLHRPKSSYLDYVEWQRGIVEGEAGETLFSFWKNQLGSGFPILNLPTDKPRPAIQTYNGACRSFTVNKNLSLRLKALAKEQETTLFTVLLTAFQVLLHKYTGQEDILIGSPTYGRSRADFTRIVGDCINTVVLKGQLCGNPKFVDLLVRGRQVVLEALKHQDYPFPLLVQRLSPPRDPSRSPIYQVLFVLQKFDQLPELQELMITGAGSSEFDFAEIRFKPFVIPQQEGVVELVLEMAEAAGQLGGNLKYNTDLFNAETVERMAGHFERLLESITANPEQRLSELALLGEAERHQLVVGQNKTEMEYPREKTLVDLFEAQVKRCPESTAVVCAGRSLSYGDLNRQANQLAHHLRSLGAQPDNIVGICTDRSLDMVVGLLGILKAGSAYLPLDPHFPEDRIGYMLKDSRSNILITQSRLRGDIKGFSGEIICIDSDWDKIGAGKKGDPTAMGVPNDLAYVIYTSGSTGKPKGVQISHRAVVNFLCSMRKEPGLTKEDTLLSVTTMSFDIFALELFLPLITGARVVISEREDSLDGLRLTNLIKEHSISVMQATPSTWRLLIESGWTGHDGLKILCGGEAFPSDLAAALLERCKELWNLYGPTETTIWSTAYRVKSKEAPILIGKPIANTKVYILDNSLQPVPIGIVGELYIGGDGLSRGYLNRPELTAEKFIPNPFKEEGGDRIYKTGDLARYRPDGEIECLGRIDHQVKLRGFRIELGEIETRMKDEEAVGNCVVVLREDRPGDQRLVAYYVLKPGFEALISDWRNSLRSKLPEYMVPQHYVELESIPLTPNGKVDRKALPKPEAEAVSETTYVAPRSATEKKIAAIWREVLNREEVGANDDFFELGGHSLLATQVMSRINQVFNIQLPLRSLFEMRNIRTLAGLITLLWASKSKGPVLRPPTEEREIIEV